MQANIEASYGAIYNRNDISALFLILTYSSLESLNLEDGDILSVNFETGNIINKTKNKSSEIDPFSEVQLEIYKNDGLF